MIGELATVVRAPFRGLLVALAGSFFAYLWYRDHQVEAVILALAACAAGLLLDWIGRRLLPWRPVLARRFLEGWVLTPAALGAAAGGVVVLVTVALTVPDGTAASTKETVGALSTGLTSFLTATFIAWSGDDDDSTVADHIRDAFYAAFNPGGSRFFPAHSQGEQWVFADAVGGVEGWGHAARVARARGIAAELPAHRDTTRRL